MARLIICADYFEEVSGGAEKTFGVLSDAVVSRHQLKKNEVLKIETGNVDVDFVNGNRDATWLIGNYYFLIQNNLLALFEGIDYHIVEFDYKICPTRNFEFYKYSYGRDYEYDGYAESIDTFLSNAKRVFFMSSVQMNRHIDFLKKIETKKCKIAGSCFNEEVLDVISKLSKNKKNKITAVYGQPTWQKGLGNSIFWCEQNKKKYVNLYNLEYKEFLSQLSRCERLVFLPNGADTAPRTVMEAKLLGLDLVLNDMVEHANESWFSTDNLLTTIKHLKSTPDNFAKQVNI